MTAQRPDGQSATRVGIVVVSHSAKLAEGIVDLAREMAGPEAQLAAAGGLAADEAALGTDVERIQRAIEAVYSEAGVLVLMDLGSALLSADMAVEACPVEWRSRILLGAAPLVEGAVAAAVQARLGSPLAEVAAAARGALEPKVAQLEGEDDAVKALPAHDLGGIVPQPPALNPQPPLQVVIHNPHGLHARPAARLIETAARFQSDIQARNLTTGQGPSSARSLVGLATLGVLPGHLVEFSASGPDAAEALQAIRSLAANGFGETTTTESAGESARDRTARPDFITDNLAANALRGLPGSVGVALGEAWPMRIAMVASDVAIGEPAAEWDRLQEGLRRAREQLVTLKEDLRRAGQTTESEIIAAHLTFLDDETLLGAAREAIFAERRSAPAAWRNATAAAAARFEALSNPYARARAADMKDIGNRVLAFLADGPETPVLPSSPAVLIADDLGPGDVASLDRAVVRAICLARGAPTSHAAILARGLGIPAVVGLGPAILSVPAGTPLLVDGANGIVWPDPDAATRERYAAELAEARPVVSPLPLGEGQGEGALIAGPSTEAHTRDGVTVPVLANVGSLAEARAALAAGAEGIGLLRTEFLFLGRSTPPSEDEQVAAYTAIASALGGRPVTIRTLDAGGDKPLPYLHHEPEENPFLGRRSIRLSLAHRDLFAAQLRAIARVGAVAPVRLMFPLIATLDEWQAARELLRESVKEVRRRGKAGSDSLEVGIMVEVPSAALAADQFAAEVDFFSIGTNDLAQYTMAADRGNPDLAPLADALQPSVLRLIQMTASAARAHGKPVSICGEVAADPRAVPLLVGLGVDSVSVAPSAIPAVRTAIAAVDSHQAKRLASAALTRRTAAEVRALVVK